MAKKSKELAQLSDREVAHSDYVFFIAELKAKVRSAQLKAAVAVNKELIQLYWSLGESITKKQEQDGWGSKVIERVAKDLQNEFPGIEGFSQTNIGRMKSFYVAYAISAQPVPKLDQLPMFNIPWGHNVVLLYQLKDLDERLWYANRVIERGWAREALIDAIKAKLHLSQGKAITNFHNRLPDPQSRLAHETLKDPYNFDFLELQHAHIERDLETGLLDHIEKFMRELGQGFAFVGRQVQLNVSNKDFYLDLLFYHLKLRCFIVVELKATDYQPEFAGKLNFYLSAVDDLMRHPGDNPTIGLLICKRKDDFIAEYSLRDINKPIGIAEYESKIAAAMPDQLKASLPTIKEIEEELSALKALKAPKVRVNNKKKS